MLIICSWRPWQKVHKKVSQPLDLLLTFCLNLFVVFQNQPNSKTTHINHYKGKPKKAIPNTVIPLISDKQVSWGDCVGFPVRGRTGDSSVPQCSEGSSAAVTQGSWNSHIPNAHFALPLAWWQSHELSASAALAQPVPHEPSKPWGYSVFSSLSALQRSLTRTPAKIWFGTFLKV